jgi:hypothetical protein
MIKIKTIRVRGLLTVTSVEAAVIGEWAAHKQIHSDAFCITHIESGLSLPFAWASFHVFKAALGAAERINRLKNSWHLLRQDDLTMELKDRLVKICRTCGAFAGENQMTRTL